MKKYSLERFKEEKKNKRMYKFTAVIIVVTLVLIIVSLYIAHQGFRSFVDTYILKKEISEENANSVTIDTEKLSLIYAFNKNLVIYSEGNVNFYNTDAKKVGNIEITISKPIADSEGKYLILGDYGLQKMCLIKDTSLLWQKDIEGKISKICVNKNGYVAVCVTGTTYESIVMLFNPKGELIFSKYTSDYVIGIDISEDDKYVAIALIDNTKLLPETEVQLISVEKAIKDAENATINTYKTDNGEVLSGIKFQKKDNLICAFDSYVLKINSKNSEKIYEISALTAYVDTNLNNGFARVDKEKSSVFKSDYRLKIKNNSNSEKIYIIEGSIKNIKSKDNIVAINLGTMALFIKDNGWLDKRFISTQEIKDIYLSSQIGVIVYKDKISIIKL